MFAPQCYKYKPQELRSASSGFPDLNQFEGMGWIDCGPFPEEYGHTSKNMAIYRRIWPYSSMCGHISRYAAIYLGGFRLGSPAWQRLSVVAFSMFENNFFEVLIAKCSHTKLPNAKTKFSF